MKKTLTIMAMVIALALSAMAPAVADEHVTPSTNDENREQDWSHFNISDTRPGEVDIEFVQPRDFAACFEYRIDGEEPTVEAGPDANFNEDIDDGLWEYTCLVGDSEKRTFEATEQVEIRMVFGAESSERFDWTPVDVPAPLAKDDCKDGGWDDLGYRNQGQCVSDFASD